MDFCNIFYYSFVCIVLKYLTRIAYARKQKSIGLKSGVFPADEGGPLA